HEFYNHFFFQAEDGIRDFHVTGVQTCALPISRSPGMASETMPTRVPARYPGSQASSSTRIRILLVFPSGTTSSWVRWKGSMSVWALPWSVVTVTVAGGGVSGSRSKVMVVPVTSRGSVNVTSSHSPTAPSILLDRHEVAEDWSSA